MTNGEIALGVLAQAVALCVGLAWPVVVFMLVLVVILAFRKQIPQVVSRLSEFAFPGGRLVFLFGDASVDRSPELAAPEDALALPPDQWVVGEGAEERDEPAEEDIKWENTGNLYWLARDLTWTMDIVLRGGGRAEILFRLRRSLLHAEALGLSNTRTGAMRESALAELERRIDMETEWTAERRDEYARSLFQQTRRIGNLAVEHQVGYQRDPQD